MGMEYNPSTIEMMKQTNLYAFCVSLICIVFYLKELDCVITDELFPAINYITSHPGIIQYFLIYGIVSSVGVLCVFATVVSLGSLVVSIITTTRKFLSIFLSIYLFNHKCSILQYLTIISIFITVAFNLYHGHFNEKKNEEYTSVPNKKIKDQHM